MPYRFCSGCAVKNCMTVIGNNGALQETIKLRQQSATVSLEVGAEADFFVSEKNCFGKATHKTQKHKERRMIPMKKINLAVVGATGMVVAKKRRKDEEA